MENFKNLVLEPEYRTKSINVSKIFFIPVLKRTVKYKRAVGFFSSTALIEISDGIDELVRNSGKIQLIVSLKLSDDDIEAMKTGYEKRAEIINASVTNAMLEPINLFEKERLNYLANLIASEVMDIRVAFVKSKSVFSMYHEKMGIMTDSEGNKIAFSGSLNDSTNSFMENYEAIDVFLSWDDAKNRVGLKENAFDKIWENTEDGVDTRKFDSIKDEIIKKYFKHQIDLEKYYFDIPSDETHRYLDKGKEIRINREKSYPKIPSNIDLYDYQKDAIKEWEKRDYKGIFDMATGTGKTLTGLGAITAIFNNLHSRLAVIIVCPYQHLVEQWYEDVVEFNVLPIVGYSSSKQKKWKKKLVDSIFDQNLGMKGKDFFLFLTTNATFSSPYVQNQLSRVKSKMLIVIDEAHNFGSSKLISLLDDRFNYRLALSATLERHHDAEGTSKLYNFFGEKCIEYTLERAIKEKRLSQYKYFPEVVYLSDKEKDEYEKLSYELSKAYITDKFGKRKLSKYGEYLAIKRSRIIAGAVQKIDALKDLVKPYKNDSHSLVYCGATSISETNDEYLEFEEDDIRQIDYVSQVLWSEYEMKIAQFTSRESVVQREILKAEFAKGDNLQVLVAIKCLDEGVNIPSIKRAFILASTTNPKEYIQRRGRVLRLAKNKKFAEIYDFVTLPRNLEGVHSLTKEEASKDKSLVKNEIKRIYEFSRLSMNPMQSIKLINRICEAYDINLIQILEEEVTG